MRDEVLQSTKLKSRADAVVWAEIDLDRQLSLAREMNIRAVPTMVFEDPNGREIRRIVGALDAQELILVLDGLKDDDGKEDQGEEGDSSTILWTPEGYRAGSICFANVGYGPLRLRSQSGFQALRLMMVPRAPSTLSKGKLEVFASGVWTNLWSVKEGAFHPEEDEFGPYLIDSESMEINLAMSYGISDTFEVELGYEMRSHFGGVLDGVIEGFHDFIGAGQQGRDRWPRDEFHFFWNPENGGEQINLSSADSGIYIQNLLLTFQHNMSCGGGWWPAISWWATLRVGLQAKGFEGRPVDSILGVALAQSVGDLNFYLSVSNAWYSENRAFGTIDLKSTQGSVMLSGEWRIKPTTSLVLQLLFSEGVVKDIRPFNQTSKEIILGMKHEIGGRGILEFGIIENFAPFENSPDMGLHVGYTRRY